MRNCTQWAEEAMNHHITIDLFNAEQWELVSELMKQYSDYVKLNSFDKGHDMSLTNCSLLEQLVKEVKKSTK